MSGGVEVWVSRKGAGVQTANWHCQHSSSSFSYPQLLLYGSGCSSTGIILFSFAQEDEILKRTGCDRGNSFSFQS